MMQFTDTYKYLQDKLTDKMIWSVGNKYSYFIWEILKLLHWQDLCYWVKFRVI